MELKNSQFIRDICAIFDTKLTFVPHLDDITAKAGKMMGSITRQCNEFTNLRALYDSFERSIFDFACLI